MTSSTPPCGVLAALTAAALAIPAPAGAGEAPGAPLQLDYRFSAYREGRLGAGRLAAGSGERYHVDSHLLRAAKTLDGTTELAAELAIETMGGASPWFVTPGADGRPLQVMSGASISERRQAVKLGGTHRLGEASIGVTASYSHERDYRSAGIGVEGSWSFNQQLDTLSAGLAYTDNRLSPTEGGSARFPGRIERASSHEFTGVIGYARVLDAHTQVQASLSYSRLGGHLSDPYKLAYVGGALLADQRPDGRQELAWLTRLRRHVPAWGATLHLDYRYFSNDWRVRSHTVDAAWYQPLPQGWQVVPRMRWYSQSQAFFYAPYYQGARADHFSSSDYRLSPYGALSLSLEASRQIDDWTVRLRYETYRSGRRFALRRVDMEHPGLVDFQVLSIAVGKPF
ncbi:DUF3570 domain-containing protein [Aquincola sp. MAHUQ-54]|uniref:DUF3570 domain-containing protein n=1 Tax=Aquincola agrisoli TaxID=3119538 RepID=A0AAW9QI11_9BURK